MQDGSTSNAKTRTSPPRAPLAFRVGVLGHRPARLGAANLAQLTGTLGAILAAVKDEVLAFKSSENAWLYDDAEPILRAISPLAEGTDRIFAEQALVLGFELCCITPFPVPLYEQDFAPGKALESNSLARFRTLLDRAETRFELDGTHANAPAAYGAGGRVVLNQSDILIVVWDGERRNKRGGTEETFDEARRLGLPVIWVDASAPHAWRLLSAQTPLPMLPPGQRVAPDGSGSVQAVRKWVREILELPELAGGGLTPDDHEASHRSTHREVALRRFYAERQPRRVFSVLWKIFQNVVGDGKWPKLRFRTEDFEKSVESEWPRDRSAPLAQVIDDLRPYYAWSDKLAVVYADRYRSAYLLVYLLAAVAVGLALLPVGMDFIVEHFARECNFIELVSIVAILVIVHWGRRRLWHERFLDYRLAAELVRHLRVVAPMGGRWPIPQIPAHWATYGQPAASWMVWYVRAVERWLQLPSAVVDSRYIDAHLSELGRAVGGQVDFHQATNRRGARIEHRLHGVADWLFSLTIVACAIHLAIHDWSEHSRPGWIKPLMLVFVCGFFPALGAALAAIMNQAEFRRLANRSKATGEQLRVLHSDIKKQQAALAGTPAPGSRQPSVQVLALASTIAGLLVAEVLDWRVILVDRPLES